MGVYQNGKQLKCSCGNTERWVWISQGPKGQKGQCGDCSTVVENK